MEPKKFENNIQKVLGEREIKPSAESWKKLEQRLDQDQRSRKPYLLWVSAAAAIAVVFFILGGYFNSSVPLEAPQLVEEITNDQEIKEKTVAPEEQQVAASEVVRTPQETSVKKPAEKATFKHAVSEASEEKIAMVSTETSEATEAMTEKYPDLVEEIKTELAGQNISSEVSDHEIEALLLLASAQLEVDPVYSVNANDLLDQVEYEMEQSFRQKVFEVVKEGLLKAKTAVASRDY